MERHILSLERSTGLILYSDGSQLYDPVEKYCWEREMLSTALERHRIRLQILNRISSGIHSKRTLQETEAESRWILSHSEPVRAELVLLMNQFRDIALTGLISDTGRAEQDFRAAFGVHIARLLEQAADENVSLPFSILGGEEIL
jgi:hypothetical protein